MTGPGAGGSPAPYSARPAPARPYAGPGPADEGYEAAVDESAPFGPPEFGDGPFGPPGAVPQGVYAPAPVPRMRDYSWIHIELPPPKVVKVHDIITVIVSENSEVTSDSRFERQRNAQLRAQLRQFIRLDDDLNLRPAAKDSPTIDGQLRSQLQSNGLAKTREGIRYRIAATVVDVLPNGTLILEARKTIRTNEDLWEYALVGKIRGEDVLANNTVLSENIADLGITKTERGKVADSTKRGWFLRIYDALLPF
jgi:flagellar L-ring protein precursor FlgH